MTDKYNFPELTHTGIAIPSLTSLVYYGVFLFLLSVWSVHLGLRPLVRGLRVLLMLYSSLHLLLLHLYQFQSAQDNIPILPNNTISSLVGRCACVCMGRGVGRVWATNHFHNI